MILWDAPVGPAQWVLKRGRIQTAILANLADKNLFAPRAQHPVARFLLQVVCNMVVQNWGL